METVLFHPKIVHFPIALAMLLPVLSGGLLLCWWRAWLPRRSWWLVMLAQILLAVTSYLALESGEAEEERVEALVPERALEAHEDAAEVFLWGTLLALLPLGLGVLPVEERLARGGAALGVVASLVVLGLGYRVGEAGGSLVYGHNAGAAYARTGIGGPTAGEAGAGAAAEGKEGRAEEEEDD